MASRVFVDVVSWRRMLGIAALVSVGALFGLCTGLCFASPTSQKQVSWVKTVHGKSFVVANGHPYLMYGVQMRIDHVIGRTYSTAQAPVVAEYFEHAKSLGFRTVAVPVRWSYIEPSEGNYDFAYLDMVIDDAKANDLSLQLLWYGSDVCGFNLVPPYVDSDHVRFPRVGPNGEYFDLSNANLIGREKAVVAAMMAHIATYDQTKRVVMVQVENEPDGAGPLTKDLKWGDDADMTAKMYAGNQFGPAAALIDTIGKVVHDSPCNVVTRCNIGTSYRALEFYNARPAVKPGVDIYGIDSYSLDPAETKKTINIIPCDKGNVKHQPEGGGKSGNLVNLILSDFEEGGGSLIYELRGLDGDDGIYRHPADATDWTERDGTEMMWNGTPENKTSQIRAFNSLVYKADQEIAMAAKGDCAAFNVDNHPAAWTETRNVGGATVAYQTWSGAPAFAFKDTSGNLILMNLTDGNVFTVDPAYVHGADVSVGYFDDNDAWHEQYRKPFKGNTLLMWKGDVARISVAAKPS